jgi:PAS domain S-box-containing protein
MTANLPYEVSIPYAELVEFLDNAAIGIHRVGPDGTLLWVNRAELQMLGYEAHEIVGKHISELHADKDVVADILARLERDETLQDYEARLITKSGAIKHVLINSNVYRKDGKFVHTRCFTRDITERRQAEQALATTIEQNEVFANILGHDLRNPLGAMMMAAQLAIRRTSDDSATKPLQRILMSGERMSNMIDQLLDFTRARMAGGLQLDRKPVDLDKVIRQALDHIELSQPGAQFRVETHGDLSGVFDAERIAQVFMTLAGNAADYGTAGQACRGKHVASAPSATANTSTPTCTTPAPFPPMSSQRSSSHRRDRGARNGARWASACSSQSASCAPMAER